MVFCVSVRLSVEDHIVIHSGSIYKRRSYLVSCKCIWKQIIHCRHTITSVNTVWIYECWGPFSGSLQSNKLYGVLPPLESLSPLSSYWNEPTLCFAVFKPPTTKFHANNPSCRLVWKKNKGLTNNSDILTSYFWSF